MTEVLHPAQFPFTLVPGCSPAAAWLAAMDRSGTVRQAWRPPLHL